ncbi:FAD-dependent oxidoreductase [Acinetobacter nosocomialis]|uniref:Rubredoxin n=1 Tax=Acinetobacter junii TaxID=40215 RepID=A0A365PIZ9_ACIJU|nr:MULTISPECIES: FAD-dependent oxidoreductase [Acinetobacter]ENW17464.1 hypothetical protein F926_03341 [Acinetobacter haemolyticus NIPH 261]MBR7696696.1 FAD-dependent oxidoreductase [Acinetobacter nosocomialis]QUS50183.1 FAD-dependent oxidoreductase [Acinetobacter junii]RBA30467.1 rubredoxin [Acinetobacter junii]RBA41589.1 rubredoxin [Acinetobacter junii]
MNTVQTAIEWKKYICRACGLIYDEAIGDPDSGLAAGTRFEDIPDDWECPLCGVTKLDFEPYVTVDYTQATTESGTFFKNSAEQVIIIGAGLAGWSAAEHLRRLDSNTPITIISACEANIYHKPELSIAFSRQRSLDQLIKESAPEKAKRLNVQLVTECFVTGINAQAKMIRTTRGMFAYHKLILAQGAQSFLPEPFSPKVCWRINNLTHWKALAAQLKPESTIALVGAGMIGCELAEDLASSGLRVHLIERNAYPLSTLLPTCAGQKLINEHEKIGIQFYGNCQVEKIEAQGNLKRLYLANGQILTVDFIIVSLGLKTDGRLAKQANLAFENGYLVNSATLQTSQPDIYALGDCISLNGLPCRFIEPIAKQAQAIAHHILGKDYAGYQHRAPLIKLKTKTVSIEIQGSPKAELAWESIEDRTGLLHMRQSQQQKITAEFKMAQK